MKKILLFITLFFSVVLTPKANTINTYVNDLKYNGTQLSTSSWFSGSSGNKNIYFNLTYDNALTDKWLYNSIVLCSDTTFSGGIIPNEYKNYIKDIQYNSTQYTCSYANSNYNGGVVVIINFKTFNGAGEFTGNFTTYQNNNASLQLIDYVVSDTSFVSAKNYADESAIKQNSTIINQNTQIINGQNNIYDKIGSVGSDLNSNLDGLKDKQQETNNKLDEAENTRQGIFGTLKNVLNGIIELPSKLVNLLIEGLKSLFVPTNEQLNEIIEDSKDLTENFGFVGESVNFFLTIFTSLLGMVNADGCINLPEFTIGATSLTDSITFWQSQNVCLSDNTILNDNIDTIRTITSIVLVCLFISFASSKFFSILSKNDNNSDGENMSFSEYYEKNRR